MAAVKGVSTCNLHKGKDVVAVCMVHKHLLCVTCLTTKRCKDCKQLEIGELQGQLLLDVLVVLHEVNEISDKQQSMIDNSKTNKGKLHEEVNQVFDELQQRLNVSRDAVIKTIDGHMSNAVSECTRDKVKVQDYQKELDDLIGRLGQDVVKDTEKISGTVQSIHQAVTEMGKKDLPEITFVRSPQWSNLDDVQLGSVCVKKVSDEDPEVASDEAQPLDDEYDYGYLPLTVGNGTMSMKSSALPQAKHGQNSFEAPNSFNVQTQHMDKQSPCGFTQVKIFSTNLLVLDSAHATIMIVSQDGKSLAEKSFSPNHISHIAVVSNTTFAALVPKPEAITFFEEKNRQIHVLRTQKLDCKLTGVVGFDFDPKKREFAVVSQEFVWIFSWQGGQAKGGPMRPMIIDLVPILQSSSATVEPDVRLVRCVFVFSHESTVFLNTRRQTLKSLDTENQTCTWRTSLAKDNMQPTDLTTDGNNIFVSCSKYCLQFSLDGEVVTKYPLDDITVGRPRAICVGREDNVIVMTSLSTNIEASRKIYVIDK